MGLDFPSSSLLEEDPKQIELDDGRTVTRKGYCSACGFCCRVIARVGLNSNHIEDDAFCGVRGIPRDGQNHWIDVINPCSQLNLLDNKCRIYESRPQTCQEFPIHPLQIQDSPCTYYFVDENGERVNG